MIFGEDEEDFDDEMAELFQEFIEDGSQRFAAIGGMSFPELREVIAKEAHKLKGSASNFGFMRVASLLGRIEDNIATITQPDYEATLARALVDFKASVAEVTSRYPVLKS